MYIYYYNNRVYNILYYMRRRGTHTRSERFSHTMLLFVFLCLRFFFRCRAAKYTNQADGNGGLHPPPSTLPPMPPGADAEKKNNKIIYIRDVISPRRENTKGCARPLPSRIITTYIIYVAVSYYMVIIIIIRADRWVLLS